MTQMNDFPLSHKEFIPRKSIVRSVVKLLTALCVVSLAWPVQPGIAAAVKKTSYTASVAAEQLAVPELLPPDAKNFTVPNIKKLMPALQPGQATLSKMYEVPGLFKFLRSGEFSFLSGMQKRKQVEAIYVQSGVYDLEGLTRAINDPDALARIPGGYLLKRPLYINYDATVIVQGQGKPVDLKLSRQHGAFIVNSGHFFALNASVVGWEVATNSVSKFKSKDAFRPFYTAWSGSKTYFGDTKFSSLGYSASKAYGISLSTAPDMADNAAGQPRPTGWIVRCAFTDMYYGFYSYEADDVAIVNNTYRNNVIYGIDPHDRSRRLLISGNDVSGTQHKHGIIISRNVEDSWIVDNVSYNNYGSGFMLDRSSRNNLVARNISKNNGSYGIALLESQDNVLRDNIVINNHKDGLKIRNGWNVTAIGNTIQGNGAFGVLVIGFNIDFDDTRDFMEDPYTERASLDLRNGVVSGNKKGEIRFEQVNFMRLHGASLAKAGINGDVTLFNAARVPQWLNDGQTVEIKP